MSNIEHAADLPAWAAIAVSFFLVIGAGLTLIGTIGFVRLPTFMSASTPRRSAPAGAPAVSSWLR